MTVKTVSELLTEIATNLPDNTTNLITPALMRTTLDDIVTSYLNLPLVGSIAYQNAYAVTISGGVISGVTLASSNVAITGGTITGADLSGCTLPWADITGTPGTLAGYGIPAFALTKTDDTNVTMALGGSPGTALVAAASITLGWAGTLSVPRGGTGSASLPVGAVLYGAGTSAIDAIPVNATATNKFVAQVSSGNPGLVIIQSSDVPPIDLASTANGGITGALPVAHGGTGDTSLAANGVLYGNGTSAVQVLPTNATATNKFITQVSSGAPVLNTIQSSDVPPIDLTSTANGGVTGTLPVAYGGTGDTTLTVNGLLYGNGTSAIQVAAPNATGTTKFLSQISSGVPGWTAPGSGGLGTVTSVTAGTGLTGGAITASGTISLADTAVIPNTYNSATITVDQQGRITAASSGAGDLTLNQVVVTSGATIGSPYLVPIDVQRVLINQSVGAASYVRVPQASMVSSAGLALGVLVKDLKGDADTNNITVEFTGGELCDGAATLTLGTKYGFVTVNPVPGANAWYAS